MMCGGAGAQSKFRGGGSGSAPDSEGGSEPPEPMLDSVEPAGATQAEAGPLTLQVTQWPPVPSAPPCLVSPLCLAWPVPAPVSVRRISSLLQTHSMLRCLIVAS